MNGDFISFRLVLVGATAQDEEFWRHGAALASIPIEFTAFDSLAAHAAVKRGRADIVVLCQVDDRTAKLIGAATAASPAPLVFACLPHGTPKLDGVTGVLPPATSNEEARALVEICVRTRLPTRVLLVDDSSTMRSIVRKILGASRFALDIHDASEGLDALAKIRSGHFGLVFLDYNMPGFDGVETLSEIRREKPDVKVVMMTATADRAVVERARAAGALAFLRKPFFPADVDTVMDRYYGLAQPAGALTDAPDRA